MRKLLTLIWTPVLASSALAQTTKTPTALQAEISSVFRPGCVGCITATNVASTLNDITASYPSIIAAPNTVKCNPTGSQANAQDCIGIALSQALSGSAGLGNLNTFAVTSDTQLCAFCTQIYSTWNYGGATARGARVNGFFWNIQTTANSGSGTTAGVGLEGIGQSNSGDGGTGLTNALVKGTYFGVNAIGRNAGTNVQEVVGLEADTMTTSGSSQRYNFGSTSVNYSAVQGSSFDAAFAAYSGGSIAAAGGSGPWGPGLGYHCLLCAGELSANGLVPLDSGATVLGTHLETLSNIPVNTVFDLTGYLPSAFYVNSTKWTVDQNGQPTFGTGAAGSTVVEKINGGASGSNAGALLSLQNNGVGIGLLGNVSAAFGGTFSNVLAISGFFGTTIYTNNVAAITVDTSQNVIASAKLLSSSASGGVGYATGVGAGNAVTQLTSRTTGVTLNNVTGAITLVSAAGNSCSAGLASALSFTVTDSAIAATDTVSLSQKSGADVYGLLQATNIAAGSFKITFCTTGGTTTEQPVFNFNILKGSAN